jgi:hypothetical protein
VGWYGSYLILFQQRPFARSLLTRYLAAILLGYPAIIALANSQHWPWLARWLQLWTPVVGMLGEIFPIFDYLERLLFAGGFGHRVLVIQHLLAFGWLVSVPTLVFLFVTVLRLRRDEWMGIVTVIPRNRFFFTLVLGAIFFFFAAYYVGFGFKTPLLGPYDWARNDLSLIEIGILFGALIMSAWITEVSLGAIVVGRQADAAKQMV